MASKQKAINTYRPQLKLYKTAQRDELVRYIAGRTGLNEGTILLVLYELRDALLYFGREGRGLKLDGIGTFLPSITLNGIINMRCRLDRGLKKLLNYKHLFKGKIINKRNIGKTPADLVVQWNENNPDDLVT